MQAFRPGLERIVKGSQIPVVPVYIGGAWGSWFSHYRGAIMASLPRRFPYPVSVSYGSALPADTPSFAVRQAVCALASEAACLSKTDGDVLSRRFIRQARRHWWRRAMTDSTGRRLSFGQVLVAATVLSRALRKAAPGQRYVGVLMPTVAVGALVNIALTLLGKIPVNLNYTASASAVAAAIGKCGIHTVIASRAFLEKLDAFQAPPETVYIEDIAAGITRVDKLRGSLAAWLLPGCLLREKGLRRVHPDDPATVIFSSGSTAEPKGVMLSHANLIANVASVQMVFRFEPRDRLCGILPFFHAFGFTVTLWGPLLHGFSVSFHPNPLDGEGVGMLCREEALTCLVATPTFLLGYLRRAQPDDFRTLRAVVTGAEKLRARVADAFEERFGIRPYEGYGATELSPVAALNLPDITVDGVSQTGSKIDSVGHPVPHVAMRIVDLETGLELPPGSQGLLEVRGPNVMIGYLHDPDKTAEVLRHGWYNSGDIACMDQDGFVFLKDRLARFSKIGGEMVPHIAIEEALGEQLAATENVIAVTAVPDDRKGEQIVICFTSAAGTAAELHRLMAACAIPNLWKPRRDHYIPVDTIPMLGTGKRDLAALKELAADTMRARRGLVRRALDGVRDRL
jgi:acyl-[acyl-carrier-protein]-phospholipid O-acyltransferase / long-chain-fatty-acid--[acyl-carrier-protein] ligase